MADDTIGTKAEEVIARDFGIKPFMKGTYTVKNGVSNMKAGMIVTTFGESNRDVDIYADGDDWATGVVLGQRSRLYASDGAISGGDVDDSLIAETEVTVLHFGYNVAHIYMFLSEMVTAKGDGAIKKGNEVYLMNITATALDATAYVGGNAMSILEGALDMFTGLTKPYKKIGVLQEDVTIHVTETRVAKVLI